MPHIAKKIGSGLTLLFMVFGLIAASTIMTFMTWSGSIQKSLSSLGKFIIDLWPNFLVAIILLTITSIYFGSKAGVTILERKKNSIWIGIRTTFIVLLLSTFLASWVGFIQEGIDNIGTHDDPFVDYIFKPIYWVVFVGTIPSLILGILLGMTVKLTGKKYDF